MKNSLSLLPLIPRTSLFAAFLGIFCLLLTTACKDDQPAPPPTRAELIASPEGKSWRIEYFTVMGLVQEPEPCSADDELIFYSNKDLIYKQNALKCTPNDPAMVAGTWSLSEDEQKINISAGPITGTADIDDLTSSRMKITSNNLGVPVTVNLVPN